MGSRKGKGQSTIMKKTRRDQKRRKQCGDIKFISEFGRGDMASLCAYVRAFDAFAQSGNVDQSSKTRTESIAFMAET